MHGFFYVLGNRLNNFLFGEPKKEERTMINKISKEELENFAQFAIEMIHFLKKWGMWEGVSIFTNGNRYSYEKGNEYNGIMDVAFEENVDPEEGTKGLTGQKDSDGNYIWKSFANPEHIFDMTYDGALCMLLRYGEYEVMTKDISKEAWDIIFDKTDILDEILYFKFDATTAEEYWEQLMLEKDEDEKNVPSLEEVMVLWDEMVEEAKVEFMEGNGYAQGYNLGADMVSIHEMVEYIGGEFDALFEKYNLWYEYGFSWSLTCYEKGE